VRQREAYLQTSEPEAGPAQRPAALPAGPLTPAAIVGLQRAVGNRAVTAMIARSAPAAAAAAPDTGLVAYFENLWQENPGDVIRLGLELFRPIPLVGALPALGSDFIEMGQDLFSVPVGDPVLFGITEMTLFLRSAINIAAGGVGQILSFTETVQAVTGAATLAEAMSLIGIPEALVTGAFGAFIISIDEFFGVDKFALTTLVEMMDFIVTIEAAAGAVLGPVGDSEKWTELMTGYLANQFEDIMALINDGVGLATLEFSQPGKIDGLISAITHFVATVGPAIGKIQEWTIGFWNVLGDDALQNVGTPDLRPDEPVGLEPTDPQPGGASIGFVARTASPDDGWAAARLIELDAMRACVQTGDAVLTPVASQVGELVASAGQMADDALGGREGVLALRDQLTGLLGDVEGRLGAVASLQADTSTASSELTASREQIAGGIAFLEGLELPAFDLGAAADTVLAPVLGQLGGVLDAAKEAALAPLRDVLDGFDELDELLAAVLKAAGLVSTMLEDAVGRINEALAGCETLPDILQTMIDQSVALASGGDTESFADLSGTWSELGPQLDEASTAAQGRAR
jgi:hypothetical protein